MPYQPAVFRCAFLSCVIGAAFPTAAYCQPPANADQHGRMPDGRAYRLDGQGMRMVDYLAELEVTNDDLQRQVSALELEVAEKQRRLEQAGLAGPAPSSVREGELMPRTVRNELPAAAGRAPQPAPASLNCSALTQPLNLRIEQLQAQLQNRQVVSAPRCDYNSPENPLLDEVKRLRTQVAAAPDKDDLAVLDEKRVNAESELEKSAAVIARLKEELSAKSDEISSLEQKLDDETTQLAAQKSQPPRAALASSARNDAEAVRGSAPSSNAVQLRSEFRTELQKIQSLVIQRKNLLDAAKSRDKSISISIQPLVTRSGTTLDTLRMSAEKFTTDEEAASLRTGMNEITAVLNDDIQVLSRLAKGR